MNYQNDAEIKKRWRQIRDTINKMVSVGDRSVPLILTKIWEMLHHKI